MKIAKIAAAIAKTLAATLATTLAASSFAADLTVEIKGVNSANGQIYIGLYDKAEGWMKGGFKNVETAAKKDRVIYEFKDLPEGVYAISLYHDENGNGKFDSNLVGMPIEPYGFSNDAMGNFGPPTFEQAKFKLDSAKKTVTLNLK